MSNLYYYSIYGSNRKIGKSEIRQGTVLACCIPSAMEAIGRYAEELHPTKDGWGDRLYDVGWVTTDNIQKSSQYALLQKNMALVSEIQEERERSL